MCATGHVCHAPQAFFLRFDVSETVFPTAKSTEKQCCNGFFRACGAFCSVQNVLNHAIICTTQLTLSQGPPRSTVLETDWQQLGMASSILVLTSSLLLKTLIHTAKDNQLTQHPADTTEVLNLILQWKELRLPPPSDAWRAGCTGAKVYSWFLCTRARRRPPWSKVHRGAGQS